MLHIDYYWKKTFTFAGKKKWKKKQYLKKSNFTIIYIYYNIPSYFFHSLNTRNNRITSLILKKNLYNRKIIDKCECLL